MLKVNDTMFSQAYNPFPFSPKRALLAMMRSWLESSGVVKNTPNAAR